MRRIICDATPKNCERFFQSGLVLPGKPKKYFVNERRGLQRVADGLTAQIGRRSPLQLPVHERNEAIARRQIAASPRLE